MDSVVQYQDEAQTIKVRRRLMASNGMLGFPSVLVDKIQPGVVVHADRGSGKTKALLWAIHERHQGKAVVVVLNGQHERRMVGAWSLLFADEPNTQMPRIVATPDFIGPRSLEFAAGHSDPIYCDEWWQFLPDARRALKDLGRVAGAVGTREAAEQFQTFSL